MIILGIETSCDETAVAAVEASGDLENPKFNVLGASLISQANLHARYGGVYPNLAKREHQKNLPHVYKHALEEAKISEDKISAVAVTVGPGLPPALWVGINFAKKLGEELSVPVIPTNHMEGHIASVLLRKTEQIPNNKSQTPNKSKNSKSKIQNRKIIFPAIALLISGGHTELVLLKNWRAKKIIGETRDDAVGEAFDKVARMLDLGYPGGPAISILAEQARNSNIEIRNLKLPRPMINSEDYDFSFSGLKTAVLYYLRDVTGAKSVMERTSAAKRGQVSGMTDFAKVKIQIAREFEDAVIEVLVSKTRRAIEEHGAKSLIIGGGVIANRELRKSFEKLSADLGTSLFLPTPDLATDNAVMIAMAAYIQTDCGKNLSALSPSDFGALGNLKIN